ncbi:MAG: NADH-quinone oxidoreductase subunit J [Pseudomonadales bacterium]|nr:NADH-quinone oxidoreductase subunit J [Pseudomonadales bacterium]
MLNISALAFYLAAAVAVMATLRVITSSNPVHALLYLVLSLIAVAMVFFNVGAPFAGALEIIVYAGAIMVLFVFVVMMLNLGKQVEEQEKLGLHLRYWIGPGILSTVLLAMLVMLLLNGALHPTTTYEVSAQSVGAALFGPYVLAVELASMILLAAMVAAWHLGRPEVRE